ncbi:MAG TPA: glycoside hydrolase family 20 zincin-like fold domain-containing protein [Armatimonadota bacterium]
MRRFLLALALAAPIAAMADTVTLSSGDLRLVIGDGSNVRLFVKDIPFITESSLYVVAPGWAKVYLNHDKLSPKVTVTDGPDGKTAALAFENADAYARYAYTLGTDNRFTVATQWGVKNGKPALVEYHTYLNANVLEGAPYTVTAGGNESAGVVSMLPKQGTQIEKMLSPNLSRVEFRTRIGTIRIAVGGATPAAGETRALTMFDARAETDAWARKQPTFWFGIGVEAKDVPAEGGSVQVRYAFAPAIAAAAGPAAQARTGILTTDAARPVDSGERPLIPAPKSVKYPRIAAPRLTASTVIRISAKPTPQEKTAAAELRAELKQWWGLSVPVKAGGKPGKGFEIALRTAGGPLKAADHPEGYTLAVTPAAAVITGRDVRGAYNGAQTLKQLFRRDERGVTVKPAVIADWPSLSMRAVHWYGGPNALPFTQRMVDRIVAPLKMNTVFQECEWTVWDSQPKIANPKRSTPKADLRRIIAVEKAHFLEVVPILSTLGHAEWLFSNGQNRDFAADPAKPYAYNPDNPRSYAVLLPIMEEALELFHPRIFHIGHDEVTLTGEFPPPGGPKTHTQLYIEDTIRLNDWLKKRGVKTMMWGDCMIHSSEIGTSAWADSKEDAVARRKAIPKDIIVADWHYRNAQPDFPSVALFQKEGFQVLPTGWSEPKAQRNLIKVAAERKTMGYMQSTWAGYAMSEEIVTGPDFGQFAAYLAAAEHEWNGGAAAPEDLPYSVDAAFLALWNRRPATGRATPGWEVSIQPPAAPFDVPARIGKDGKPETPVCLAGRLNPPGDWPISVLLPIGDRRATELEFTWALTHSVPLTTKVARLAVSWASGAREEYPITYGDQIFAFADDGASLKAPFAWRGKDAERRPVSLRAYTWANPHPADPIRSVELISENTETAPVLYALKGIQAS